MPPPISTLLSNFFVNGADVASDIAGDSTLSGESVPRQSSGNRVTSLIDGSNYFGEIRKEVDKLKLAGGTGKFFYFTNWLLQLVDRPASPSVGGASGLTTWDVALDEVKPFKLDNASPDFMDELAAMTASGTDVRSLAWVSPLLLTYERAAKRAKSIYQVNSATLVSAEALRAKPGMAKKVCLNTLAHTLGAIHLKIVICGDSTGSTAFVSGLDFASSRLDSPGHPNSPSGWHDAGVKIEGAAVADVYAYFRQLWNEQISRESQRLRVENHVLATVVEGTPEVPERAFSSVPVAAMHVQVLRTAPQMHFSSFETLRAPVHCLVRLTIGFKQPAWTSAPNGIFEFRASLHKAIMHAEKYIYVEDQGFYAQEVMGWINQRLRVQPDLKVIFVHRPDPEDGPEVFRKTNFAVNDALIAGLDVAIDLPNQIAFYERTDNVTVHAKTWLIDDVFAIVGSANFMRRSLYTDGEMSVAVIDEDATDANFVIEHRRKLWGEHCGKLTPADQAVLTNLDDAIRIWNPSWRWGSTPLVTPPVATLNAVMQSKKVPFLPGAAPDEWPSVDMSLKTPEYDQTDADSRKEY